MDFQGNFIFFVDSVLLFNSGVFTLGSLLVYEYSTMCVEENVIYYHLIHFFA